MGAVLGAETLGEGQGQGNLTGVLAHGAAFEKESIQACPNAPWNVLAFLHSRLDNERSSGSRVRWVTRTVSSKRE